ncbi:Poly [ADP-ribose] polymerase 12 [Lonchura striata]|uniref:Poly [ADP-ribose] polymerase n=1 Tax=Lonchura striata TaxID=40157 RepID=A0A218UWZ2_9PASE|nr:Poly [ADP-ribose] polymerase 12 [Lonchura striata domestica]
MALAVQALRVLCASGGCLEQGELLRRLPARPSAEQLAAVLRDAQRFTLVRRPGRAAAAAEAEVAVVVATSPVRLCPEHVAGCPGQCGQLHICKYHLKGFCRNQLARNMYDIKNGNRNMYDIEDVKSSPCKDGKPSTRRDSSSSKEDESEQICLHHLYRSCGFKEKCIRTHFHLPYRWQYSEGNTWKDFINMEEIEEAYCDPKNASICFRDMCCEFQKVRRLSTASSVTKPPHFILTTEWIWYWKDEYGMWQEYGKQDGLHEVATVSSDDLEKAYLYDSSPKMTFKAGRHEYEINFVSMLQKNICYKTERKICRRPKFVSQEEVEKIKDRGVKHTEGFKNIPAHWDKSALPELGFKLIELDCSSEEYKKVKVDFQRTMPKAPIKKICRVQNPSLWELYQWQKDLMQKSNGGKAADERFLFHGTSKKDIDAICQQNFDWRICGLHGTVYGKGSYFARDASYSDNYCGTDSNTKTMFLARVLVGEFTLGSSHYVRPPMKDSQKFYDSCVNNSTNPSIFVIFEKQQIYPEYLIEYQALARLL